MTTTGLVVTIGIIFLGIFDLVVVLKNGVGISVSRFLQRSALRSPLVAFTFGFVCGHLWGYMAPECLPENVVPPKGCVVKVIRESDGRQCSNE